jgi:mannose-6-phosphate isomerase-like protein (cupin superfamily)
MRHPILATVVMLTVAVAVAAPRAQQPPAAGGAAPAMSLFASSADVAALAARAKAEIKPGQPLLALPIVQSGSYRANLEYRNAVGPASVHEKEAELFYVIDGSATVMTGGSLTEEKRTNADNRTGTGIKGGAPRRVAKGDFILVPENTAHWFSAIDGTVTLMSVHIPKTATP